MADPSPWQATRPTNQGSGGSAVLSMEPEDVDSDGGHHDYDDPDMSKDSQGRNEGSSPGDDFRQRMSQNMTQMMWQAGTQGAKKAWNVYGNIDILRPYFNVEPREVRRRLLYSLIPRKPTAQKQEVPRELYGPVMVVLTMIALLLYQMKSADHKVADGTLMGSALGTCFMYWLGASGLVWLLAYVCSVRIVMVQILSMIVCIIMSRASGKTERIVVMATLAALHLLFLLYLHFAYHTVVEELSQVFDSQLVPEPQSAAAADSVMEKSQAAVP
ncbi:protein YIPF3-like isoform X2 [Littorina saxatilis]|uniref:protein YIPF3-like isoform X2 n=1 Tax=Littorina saxatilis TaxID=31220 RepID=UPI0038B5961B